MELYRIRTTWSGPPLKTGVTTLFSKAIPSPAVVKAFWTANKTNVPSGITWTIEGAGDKIEDSTGQLTGSWSSGGNLTETSSGSAANYAAPTGMVVRFSTQTISNRRHLVGRLFLIPCVSGVFDNDGTINSSAKGGLDTAAANLVTGFAGNLMIWSRPFKGSPAVGNKPAVPARGGSSGVVTGAVCMDYAAVLRSRRS